MLSFSMPELILTLVIALVVFGPGKLPEVGKAIGKGLQEFRRATAPEPPKELPSNNTGSAPEFPHREDAASSAKHKE